MGMRCAADGGHACGHPGWEHAGGPPVGEDRVGLAQLVVHQIHDIVYVLLAGVLQKQSSPGAV